MDVKPYFTLLEHLVGTPSLSGEEQHTAKLISTFLHNRGIRADQLHHNILAKNLHWSPEKPTVVLNSHHDTVKPVASWTFEPYAITRHQGQLIGLGVNDAGAALVGLIATFCHYYEAKDLPYNLLLIASAEEETFGPNGIRAVLPTLDFPIALAIVGEPTGMELAIAEKGLLVIDGLAEGKAGHAARPPQETVIQIVAQDVQAIHQLEFERVSPVLGPVVKTVTQVQAGTQHNVVPDRCSFVIDVRVNELYSLHEAFDELQRVCRSTLTARSFKYHPSRIDTEHPIVHRARSMGKTCFGSPTLSDQTHLSCPSVKIGPGMSERSHQANEFIYPHELENGIRDYIALLQHLQIPPV